MGGRYGPRPKIERTWTYAACLMVGCDPDGLSGELVQEVAAMAEAMKRVPPRMGWIAEYVDEAQSDLWEGMAQL